jgi:pimeloyl-ACP methyl ester carboxylesterase
LLSFVLLMTVVTTAASFAYNLATDSAAPRPAGLHAVNAAGFDTRYRSWGTTGSPVVLVPGAFETADTFTPLGAVLGRDHRVFALDLTGTGYSQPHAPFNAIHLADQVLAFVGALGLTGAEPPILVGHSSGAAVVGMAALRGGPAIAGVMFLDGDASPLQAPGFLSSLLINPFRTTVLRFALRSDWVIRTAYSSECGPTCPRLTAAGVSLWRLPLQQPGFGRTVSYMLHHGIPSMTSTEFDQLHDAKLPKSVVFGADDPQFSRATAAAVAVRIGAPAPTIVSGRHLTMISSPSQVAAAIRLLIRAGVGDR